MRRPSRPTSVLFEAEQLFRRCDQRSFLPVAERLSVAMEEALNQRLRDEVDLLDVRVWLLRGSRHLTEPEMLHAPVEPEKRHGPQSGAPIAWRPLRGVAACPMPVSPPERARPAISRASTADGSVLMNIRQPRRYPECGAALVSGQRLAGA